MGKERVWTRPREPGLENLGNVVENVVRVVMARMWQIPTGNQ